MKKNILTLIFLLALMLAIVSAFGQGNVWYISNYDHEPAKKQGLEGDGTLCNPWNLRRGFEQVHSRPGINGGWVTLKSAGENYAKPGDIVYLLGGTYMLHEVGPVDPTNYIHVTINDNSNCPGFVGEIDNPIHVRPYPGHHVIFDLTFSQDQIDNINFPAPGNRYYNNSLKTRGKYTNYYDFEVLDSHGKRTTYQAGSFPTDTYQGSFGPGGDGYEETKGLKYINLIVHDLCGGPGSGVFDIDLEIYGCIVYNNGWDFIDEGSTARANHGHGIYVRNIEGSTKKIYDNIVFNQFGYNIHAWAGGSDIISGIELERNITFGYEAASAYAGYGGSGFLVRDCEVVNVTENHLYGGSPELGYVKNATFHKNYVVDGVGLAIEDFGSMDAVNTVTYNKFILRYTGNPLIRWTMNNVHQHVVDYNVYYRNRTESWDHGQMSFQKNGIFMSFEDWQKQGTQSIVFDEHSSYTPDIYTFNDIFVYPNAYERGRANIVIYNWEYTSSISIDALQMDEIGLQNGDKYEIRNAQNFFGTPVVAEATYNGGSITVPILNDSDPALPFDGNGGYYKQNMPNTAPRFNVYVIRKLSAETDKIITGNVTWNTPYYVQNDVKVTSGGKLTINTTARFEEGVSVIIEPNGKLILNGGVLTSACDSKMWSGIKVYGKYNQPQEPENQGILELTNGAIIENAECAISTVYFYPNSKLPFTGGGGIINAKNVLFRNNLCSVVYNPYFNFDSNGNEIDNIGYFTNCTFTIDENNYFSENGFIFQNHVNLWKIRGVKYTGCTFKNETNTGGIGINAIDAGFFVKNSCSYKVQYDCACPERYTTPCLFENLYYGIHSDNSGYATGIFIDQSKFVGNDYSITINSSNNYRTTRNNFLQIKNVGLTSVSSSGYHIEGNNFYSLSGKEIGLSIGNSGHAENLVSKNNFYRLIIGITAHGINADLRNPSLKGLQFTCNSFDSNAVDIFVDDNATVRTSHGNITEGADNKFYKTRISSFYNDNFNWQVLYIHSYPSEHIPYLEKNVRVDGTARLNPCVSSLCQNEICTEHSIQEQQEIYRDLQNEYDNFVREFQESGYDYILGNFNNSDFPQDLINEVLKFINKIDDLSNSMRELSDNSISAILHDSIMDINMLKSWYELVRTPIAKYLLVETELISNNYDQADAVLHTIPEMFQFGETENAEHNNYVQFHNFKKQLQLEERSWAELNDSEIYFLQTIAEVNTGRSSTMSKGVLCFFYNICYEEEIVYDFDEDVINSKSTPSSTDEIIFISEDIINKNIDEIVKIEIYDISGRLVASTSLNGSNRALNETGVNVMSLPSGIYIAKIYTKDFKVSSSKFVKK